MLTSRQLQIIQIISNNPQGIFGKQIADRLLVSARTVRNDIQGINDQYDVIGASKVSGYVIKEIKLKQFPTLTYQLSSNVNDSAELRSLRLLTFLSIVGPVSIETLEETFYLSKTSLLTELKMFEAILIKLNTTDVIFSLNEGQASLIGEEYGIRKLYLKMVYQYLSQKKLDLPIIIHILEEFEVDTSQLFLLSDNIDHYIYKQKINLSDVEKDIVIVAFGLCLVRNSFGFKMNEVSNDVVKTSALTASVSHKLFEDLKNSFELLQSNDYVLIAELFYSFQLLLSDNKTEIAPLTKIIFEEFKEDVFEKYGIEFLDDDILSENLLIHLEYLIRRIRTGYIIYNPILGEIKQKYSFAYEIAILYVYTVYKYLNVYIQDDEISYLAIYISQYLMKSENTRKIRAVLVSNSRKSIEISIHNWVVENFSHQLKIVKTIPNSLPILEGELSDFDFGITLNHGPISADFPIYNISNIPVELDKKAIQEFIRKINSEKRYKNIVTKYFNPKLTRVIDKKISFEQCIRLVTEILGNEHIILDKEAFAEDIISREKYYPTQLNDVFMIPHPITAFSEKDAVVGIILKKPILINKKKIKIIFVIATKMVKEKSVSILFEMLQKFSQSEEVMEHLLKLEDPEKIIQHLKEACSLIK